MWVVSWQNTKDDKLREQRYDHERTAHEFYDRLFKNHPARLRLYQIVEKRVLVRNEPEFVDANAIAKRLGTNVANVRGWSRPDQTHIPFPDPVNDTGYVRFWDWAEVLEWVQEMGGRIKRGLQ